MTHVIAVVLLPLGTGKQPDSVARDRGAVLAGCLGSVVDEGWRR